MANDPNVPTPDDWRELARRIQNETDPQKMIELVQKLIERFDEEKLRKNLPPSRSPKTRSGSPEP